MNTFSRIAIAALALVTSTSALHAQVDYNRQATKISIQPNKDGSHRITGFWQAQFDTDLAVDLSSHVVLSVNGAMMWDGHVTVLKAADTGGGTCPTQHCPGNPSCGSMTSDGTFYDLHCHQSYLTMNGVPVQPPEPVCSCSGPVASIAFDFDQLNTGDIIELIIFPDATGWVELDTSDDTISTTYNGGIDRWNRRIDNVEVVARPGSPVGFGDSFFDVFVDVSLQSAATGYMNASAEVELFINGSSVATKAALGYYENDGICTGAGCPATLCGAWTVPGVSNGQCEQFTVTYNNGTTTNFCYCHAPDPIGQISFPNIPIAPTDEIVVILRPAPGALPELPPLPGTDEEGDDSANGRLPNDCPCDGDANGDGVVDVNDISFVLFRLGNLCFPV